VVREPTDMGNGMALDPQGRLIVCETASRSVKRVELDGTITTVADIYRGLRLNAPNDVVVKSDGSIYFTDPGGLLPGKDLRDDSAVFRVSADLTCINRVAGGFQLVNGLAFSPDETMLYINDSQGIHAHPDSFFSQGTIHAYDVRPGGMLANPRLFSELRGPESGMPDGMKVDSAGNVYCTGPGGVWVIDPAGRHVGTIRTGVKHNLTDTTNMAWGGVDLKTLYITTSSSLMAIQMCIAGIPTTFDRHRTGKTT
jgi:gluconolactonase